MKTFVRLSQFGKDHWSLLAYVETCAVESNSLDKRRLRCNPARHPIHAVNLNYGEVARWKPEYGTRLKGFWAADGRINPDLRLPSHDDWDCLDDLEAAGLIDVVSEANALVRMTDAGMGIAALVRKHKASGGTFATFSI